MSRSTSAPRRAALAVPSLAVLLALAAPAAAQLSCSPGPRCTAASGKAQSYIDNAQSRLRGSFIAAGAAAAAYCVDQVGAELNRLCGDEWMQMGKRDCADLAYRQQEEFVRVAKQAKAASAAMESQNGPWAGNCGW